MQLSENLGFWQHDIPLTKHIKPSHLILNCHRDYNFKVKPNHQLNYMLPLIHRLFSISQSKFTKVQSDWKIIRLKHSWPQWLQSGMCVKQATEPNSMDWCGVTVLWVSARSRRLHAWDGQVLQCTSCSWFFYRWRCCVCSACHLCWQSFCRGCRQYKAKIVMYVKYQAKFRTHILREYFS